MGTFEGTQEAYENLACIANFVVGERVVACVCRGGYVNEAVKRFCIIKDRLVEVVETPMYG